MKTQEAVSLSTQTSPILMLFYILIVVMTVLFVASAFLEHRHNNLSCTVHEWGERVLGILVWALVAIVIIKIAAPIIHACI